MNTQWTEIANRLGAWRERVFPQDEDASWQARLVQGMLWSVLAVATLAIAYFCYAAYVTGSAWVIPIYLAVYALLLMVTIARRLPYWLRAGTLLALDYVLAIVDLIESGRGGDGRIFLLVAPVIAVFLFGWHAGVIALLVNVVVMVGFGWAFVSGSLELEIEKQLNAANPYAWASNTLVLVMLGVFVAFSASFVLAHFVGALKQGQDLVSELEARDRNLQEKTRELQHSNALLVTRAEALRVVAEVARDAMSVLDTEGVLARIVTMISDCFGYYHTGIFIVDSSGEWAELRAASSDGGRRMLARHHRLRVRQEGIVGRVIAEGVPCVAHDTIQDPSYYQNPDLPNTCAEVAVPLLRRDRAIGAIDVQSTQAGAFSDDDVDVLQALADLVVVALQHAQSPDMVEQRLGRGAHGTGEGQAWRDRLGRQSGLAYRYDRGTLSRLEESSVLTTSLRDKGDEPPPELRLPIVVRGEQIGVIDAHKAPVAGDWTAGELELVEAVTEQIGTALESARLYREAQDRAARDRLIGDVTARMRESMDIESILKVAVREISDSLQLAALDVRLGIKESASTSTIEEEDGVMLPGDQD